MVVNASKSKALSIIIRAEHLSGKWDRADRVLSGLDGWPTRSQMKNLMAQGRVTRGSQPLEPGTKLRCGDLIECDWQVAAPHSLEPVAMDLKIVYEDEDLLVVYKPRGLSVHPGAGREQVTLVHGLLSQISHLSSGGQRQAQGASLTASGNGSPAAGRTGEISKVAHSPAFRPGIVHRLDKNTEGLLVVAKNDEIHEGLSQQFRDHSIDRRYWALVWGRFPKVLRVEGMMARHPHQRQKMALVKVRQSTRGKASATLAKAREVFSDVSWVECQLETGRTHQIRVHLSSEGFPVVGDTLYGRARQVSDETLKALIKDCHGQALVAYRLGFKHPRSGEWKLFEADQPEWLTKILDYLRRQDGKLT